MTAYKLKNSPIDAHRLNKQIKEILDNSKSDREMAILAYEYFKAMVDENTLDVVAKNCMVECLKLAQTARNNSVKMAETLYKMLFTLSKGDANQGSVNLFNMLEAEKEKRLDG